MKNISELLNLLLSQPADPFALSQGKNQVSQKGSSPDGTNFGNLLAQLTAQGSGSNAEGNSQSNQAPAGNVQGAGQNATPGTLAPTAITPTGQTEGSISVSQTTVAITESLKVDNLNQLAQAEQALASLANGLSQIIQMLSQLEQQQPQQAQTAISSLAGLNLTTADLQTILNSLQPLVQKLPADQNPLQMTPEQQSAFLNQMLQQMMQAQQILLGVASPNPGAAQTSSGSAAGVAGLGSNASLAGQNVTLQLLFSNTNINEAIQNNNQTTQVFINLETFKMSATFVNAGVNVPVGQNPTQGSGVQFQPIAPVNSPNLAATLNQLLANPESAPQVAPNANPTSAVVAQPATQANMNQNFNALVQILMQSGVTQAALTSFMAGQASGTNDKTNTSQTANQQTLTFGPNQILPVTNEIQPVLPSVQTGAASNNNVNSQQGNLGQNVILATEAGLVSTFIEQNDLQVNQAKPSSVNNTENIAINQVTVPITSSNNQLPPSQPLLGTGQNNLPKATVVNPSLPVVTQAPQVPQPNLTTPIPTLLKGSAPLIDVREIAILNDIVSRLNAVALHATQGSLTFGSSGQITNPTITLDQVTAAVAATQLNSFNPPVLSGSPSVPQNVQVPSPQQLEVLDQNVKVEVVAAVTQVETSQTSSSLQNNESGNQTVPPPETVPATSNASQGLSNPTSQTPLSAVSNSSVVNIQQNAGLTPPAVIQGPSAPITAASVGSTLLTPVNVKNNSFQTPPANNANNIPPTIFSLPQPATLPITPITAPMVVSTPPLPEQALPQDLNRNNVPLPTAQEPILPSAAVAGEAVKSEIVVQASTSNTNANNQAFVPDTKPTASLLPVSPEAVASVATVPSSDTTLKVVATADKNLPNATAILNANAVLGATVVTPGNPHSNTPFVLPNNSANSLPTGSIDSAQILNQISQQVANQAAEGKNISRLNFQLFPESLGKVTVQIALVDQSVSARIIVSNPDVRDAIQNHMVDLKTALSQAGLQIDQLQVQVQGGGANLLAQYYQYQQEGSSYRGLVAPPSSIVENAENPENSGLLAVSSGRLSLVDLLV